MSNEGMIVVGVDGSDPSRAALEFALEEAARRTARVRVVVAFHPPESWPVAYGMAPVMADQAADADLLVVEHRGRGGLASACLGSVGLRCVLHARCPVTVVRPPAASTPRQDAAGAVAAGRPL